MSESVASPRSQPLRSARPTRHLEDSTTCRRSSTPRSTTTTSTSTGTRASACAVFPRASMRYLICCTRTNRVRAPKSRVPPRSTEPATGTTAMPRAISESCAVLNTHDTRVRAPAYRSAGVATCPPARFPRARAGIADRACHSTPSKSVRRSPRFPLYRHRQTRRASPRHRQAPAQGSLALRSTFPNRDTARRRRLARTPAIPKLGVETASLPLGTRSPGACAGVPCDSSSPRARVARSARRS